MACFRVACGAFPAIRASAISRAVIGRLPAATRHRAPEQRPALEPRIALVASFRADASNVKAWLEHLQDGFNLHHGRLDLDASVPAFRELPRQFGVKLGQGEHCLLGCYFGSGHREAMVSFVNGMASRFSPNPKLQNRLCAFAAQSSAFFVPVVGRSSGLQPRLHGRI
jgi:hypothetical protein